MHKFLFSKINTLILGGIVIYPCYTSCNEENNSPIARFVVDALMYFVFQRQCFKEKCRLFLLLHGMLIICFSFVNHLLCTYPLLITCCNGHGSSAQLRQRNNGAISLWITCYDGHKYILCRLFSIVALHVNFQFF